MLKPSDVADPVAQFEAECAERARAMAEDDALRDLSREWLMAATPHRYAYNFRWLGRPIIQFPQDVLVTQEIIWNDRPDLVIETGIAHGGSILCWASIMELAGIDGRVVGVDVEIRPHNRAAIEAHPMARRVTLVEGSSTDEDTVDRVRAIAEEHERVMVVLDAHHSHAHVLGELERYGPLVTAGCHLVVCDTVIEDLPAGFLDDARWDVGDNPKTAVRAFLETTDRFTVDRAIEDKLMISSSLGGYLTCVR